MCVVELCSRGFLQFNYAGLSLLYKYIFWCTYGGYEFALWLVEMVSLPLGSINNVFFYRLFVLFCCFVFWFLSFCRSLVSCLTGDVCVSREGDKASWSKQKNAYAWFSLLQNYVWAGKSHENVIRDFWRNHKLPKRDIKRIVRCVEV